MFESIGLAMAPAIIHRLKVHRDASRDGLTPQETEPTGKAAAEIAALWDYLKTHLDNDDRAGVQNASVQLCTKEQHECRQEEAERVPRGHGKRSLEAAYRLVCAHGTLPLLV